MGSHLKKSNAAPVNDGSISLAERLFGRRYGRTSVISTTEGMAPSMQGAPKQMSSSNALEGSMRHEGLQGVKFMDNFVVFGPEGDATDDDVVVRFDI